MPENLIHLRRSGTSVVIDVSGGVPVIAHWGKELDAVTSDMFTAIITPKKIHGIIDAVPPIAVVPQHADGCYARPGLAGHRPGGRHFAPRFMHAKTESKSNELIVTSFDKASELTLRCNFVLEPSGVLSVCASVTNNGVSRYLLDTLTITLPLPRAAEELVTMTGRWAHEFSTHRQNFSHGAWTSENRTGRTSHEHPPVIWACESGASEWSGEVWGAHLAWSGNHVLLAEVLSDRRKYLQLGELQLPGEICLEPQGSYTTPTVIATYSSSGFTSASLNFHRNVRANLPKKSVKRTRKVLLNTWEAVYFDHNEEKLKSLAERASKIGVERFVLDDGWFGSRRNDATGLGDWWVSPEVYPQGLQPLISHVTSLGMDFGIWVEPEMVNPDSELFRAHPEWALVSPDHQPVTGRNQLVLNLVHEPAFKYVFEKLDKLLSENQISFIKWDMNRPHVQATLINGAAGTHQQTLAVYRLINELRRKHPTVEIESCASGGGRVDHEILRLTDRVWTSDCNDPHQRQIIQRGASMFIPNEVMGMHIGAQISHTTSKSHSLEFRATTALFGHLGLELDLTTLTDAELETLSQVISWHKSRREFLHNGDAVRFDSNSKSIISHGVYSTDRKEAYISVASLETSEMQVANSICLPGLNAECEYQIKIFDSNFKSSRQVASLTGKQLGVHGLNLPEMRPESAIIFHLLCV